MAAVMVKIPTRDSDADNAAAAAVVAAAGDNIRPAAHHKARIAAAQRVDTAHAAAAADNTRPVHTEAHRAKVRHKKVPVLRRKAAFAHEVLQPAPAAPNFLAFASASPAPAR